MVLLVLRIGAEGMIVLVEFAWLKSISGADAPSSPISTAFSSGTGRPAMIAVLLLGALAAFENN